MTRIVVALFNYQDGGRTGTGTYDFSKLQWAFAGVDEPPGFDFGDGADSVIISGHKFLGSPVPCGILVTRGHNQPGTAGGVSYPGSPDTTLLGSRSGHAPLILAHALRRHGVEGLRVRADQSRQLAAYTHAALAGIGWPAWRNPHAFTVVLATPPPAVTGKWVLAGHGDLSHIVCMPGVTTAQIDQFVADLHAATADPPLAAVDGDRRRGPRALRAAPRRSGAGVR